MSDRQIKFRVWCDGDMYDAVHLYHSYDGAIECVAIGYLKNPHSGKKRKRIDDVCLMQFTGLKDRNGVDIYEGDVIDGFWNSVDYDSYPMKNKVVKYVDELQAFGFPVTIRGDQKYPVQNYPNCMYQFSDIEVIGNVHENIELMSELA